MAIKSNKIKRVAPKEEKSKTPSKQPVFVRSQASAPRKLAPSLKELNSKNRGGKFFSSSPGEESGGKEIKYKSRPGMILNDIFQYLTKLALVHEVGPGTTPLDSLQYNTLMMYYFIVWYY